MKALSIVGYKNSGKTGLAVKLAQALNRAGLKVAAAKSSHHGLDKEDTDTDKLLSLCTAVVGFGPGETAVFWPKKRYVSQLRGLMDADFLIVEGGKQMGWLPRVVVPTSVQDLVELEQGLSVAVYDPEAKFVSDNHGGPVVVRDVDELARIAQEKGFSLPDLNCGDCGREDCRALAREIVAGKASLTDCRAVRGDFSITINGQELAMKGFVRDIVSASIKGMLSELKGFQPGIVNIRMEV